MDLDTSEPAAPRRPGLRARAVVRAASPPTGGPAFVPFQLSDEQYASVYRDPDANGYPTLVPGAVRAPKFGYIYVEQRSPGGRRPKLVDGLDWVPSSSANASYKMLKDGRSEIVRFYCSRRTKGEHARPQQKPYNVFAAERQEEVKAANPELNSYDVKKVLGQQWREMGAAAKRPYQEQSQHENRQLRQRMSAADPQQLLVRHEIWIQPQGLTRSKEAAPERVIVHYLGSQPPPPPAAHAAARARFPPLTTSPPPARRRRRLPVPLGAAAAGAGRGARAGAGARGHRRAPPRLDAPERLEVDDDDDDDDGATATHGATTLAPVHQTSDVQIILGCKLIPRPAAHDGGASSLLTDSYSGSGSASGEEHFSEEATAEDASPASADAAGTSLFALPAPAHAYATRGSGAALITAVSSTAAGAEGADAGIDFSPRLHRRVGVKSGHGRRGSADEPARKVAAAGADFIFPFPTNESPPAPARRWRARRGWRRTRRRRRRSSARSSASRRRRRTAARRRRRSRRRRRRPPRAPGSRRRSRWRRPRRRRRRRRRTRRRPSASSARSSSSPTTSA